MSSIQQKNLEHLNLRVTLLGYPLLVGLLILVVFFLVNIFGIAFTTTIAMKVVTILVDSIFIFITYLNYNRIKRHELSIFSYWSLKKLPKTVYDNDNTLNYFIKCPK